ncbi:MAG TPA: radical SAM protein [Synergistales bacterium]|nr:radical SAM protein [Synergistales bacterium]
MLGSRISMSAALPKIPFFLPMDSCPRRCVYCHQGEITGISEVPSPDAVQQTLSRLQAPHEVCYFGGSFTCFPEERRRAYMEAVFAAPERSCVRFSTHPHCLSPGILDSLASYPVSMIELGISSLDDDVLNACNRGYTGEFAIAAMRLILERGFSLGAQLMIGLPGQRRADLARDIELFRELDLDMIGVGPFVPDPQTPLGQGGLRAELGDDQVANDATTTYTVIALARLACPRANIPSTTALATREGADGQMLALSCGANVIMPNVTPARYRTQYEIYPQKACYYDDSQAAATSLRKRIAALGRTVGIGRGDSPNVQRRDPEKHETVGRK